MHGMGMGMGSLGHTLQTDLPRDWANLAVDRDVWRAEGGGQPALRCLCGIFVAGFCYSALLYEFAVGGLSFDFKSVVHWRRALQSEYGSEWPSITNNICNSLSNI